jgi:hypothetical protein
VEDKTKFSFLMSARELTERLVTSVELGSESIFVLDPMTIWPCAKMDNPSKQIEKSHFIA